jgi:predicted nucleotidyltransferase
MIKKRTIEVSASTPNRLLFAEYSLAQIRRFARWLGERFQPEKIILFGSYAYGIPRPGSDIDILVVMPCYNEISQAVRIDLAIDPNSLPVHITVVTPKRLARRLAEGESFMCEVISRGKVVYETGNTAVGKKSRRRPQNGKASRQKPQAGP